MSTTPTAALAARSPTADEARSTCEPCAWSTHESRNRLRQRTRCRDGMSHPVSAATANGRPSGAPQQQRAARQPNAATWVSGYQSRKHDSSIQAQLKGLNPCRGWPSPPSDTPLRRANERLRSFLSRRSALSGAAEITQDSNITSVDSHRHAVEPRAAMSRLELPI